MRRSRSCSRCGFTILEVGVIITLSVMLVSLAVVLFSSLLHAQRQTRQRDRIRRELMRLDVALRRDLHAITQADADDQGTVTLQGEQGNRWQLQIVEGTIVREHYREDKVLQREVFHLLPGMQADWTLEDIGARQKLELQISFPKASGRMPVRLADYRGEFLVGGFQAAKRQEREP